MRTIKSNGGKRMMELGKKPVQLWLTVKEHELLTYAAKASYRPLTQFILRAAVEEARRSTDR